MIHQHLLYNFTKHLANREGHQQQQLQRAKTKKKKKKKKKTRDDEDDNRPAEHSLLQNDTNNIVDFATIIDLCLHSTPLAQGLAY